MRHASPVQDLVVNHLLQETNDKVFIFLIQMQGFKYEQKPSHIFQTIAKDTSDTAFILGRKPHWVSDWAFKFMVHSTRIPYAQEEPLWVSPKLPETVRPPNIFVIYVLHWMLYFDWLFPWHLNLLAKYLSYLLYVQHFMLLISPEELWADLF